MLTIIKEWRNSGIDCAWSCRFSHSHLLSMYEATIQWAGEAGYLAQRLRVACHFSLLDAITYYIYIELTQWHVLWHLYGRGGWANTDIRLHSMQCQIVWSPALHTSLVYNDKNSNLAQFKQCGLKLSTYLSRTCGWCTGICLVSGRLLKVLKYCAYLCYNQFDTVGLGFRPFSFDSSWTPHKLFYPWHSWIRRPTW